MAKNKKKQIFYFLDGAELRCTQIWFIIKSLEREDSIFSVKKYEFLHKSAVYLDLLCPRRDWICPRRDCYCLWQSFYI